MHGQCLYQPRHLVETMLWSLSGNGNNKDRNIEETPEEVYETLSL